MFGVLGIVIGILLILAGGYLVLFFPMSTEHQDPKEGVTGIVLGFILLVIGFVLVFF